MSCFKRLKCKWMVIHRQLKLTFFLGIRETQESACHFELSFPNLTCVSILDSHKDVPVFSELAALWKDESVLHLVRTYLTQQGCPSSAGFWACAEELSVQPQ